MVERFLFNNALKARVAKELLEDNMIGVQFCTAVDKVIIPPHLKEDVSQVLNFSHKFYIPDFECNDEAIQASLSFGGKDFFCSIPWDAVYTISCDKTQHAFHWLRGLPPEHMNLIYPPDSMELLRIFMDIIQQQYEEILDGHYILEFQEDGTERVSKFDMSEYITCPGKPYVETRTNRLRLVD